MTQSPGDIERAAIERCAKVAEYWAPEMTGDPVKDHLPVHMDEACVGIAAAIRSLPSLPANGEVGALREALEPFARIAGPINGEDGRPTYLEAIEGKEPTGELYVGSHFGTDREETLWADDFRRARQALATPSSQGDAAAPEEGE